MKTLIVYDSVYGNTEKIADAIGNTIAGEVKVLRVSEVNPSEFGTIDLLIIGFPTHAGRPTQAIQTFLKAISPSAFKNANAVAFDTRQSMKLVGIFGYAADKIVGSLKKNGWTITVPPKAFFVKGKNGPLKEGELERAVDWAKEIVQFTS